MMKIVCVKWHDAHADRSGGWVEANSIDALPYVVTSVGWLISPAPKTHHVSIAQSEGDESVLDHVIHIPSEMIQHMSIWDYPPSPVDN